MKKIFWVKSLTWDKKVVTTALEAWADAIFVNEEKVSHVKNYWIIKVISTKWADLNIWKDVEIIKITSKEKEKDVVKLWWKIPVIIQNADWTIIPLENLISKTINLIQEVYSSDQWILALQTMEKWADWIILETNDLSEIKKMWEYIRKINEPNLKLETVKITWVTQTWMCDRCCLDTWNLLEPWRWMLIWNTSSAFFLVHNENVESPYCDARPFRVNAWAVHAYILLPWNKTKYLSELNAWDKILSVNEKWECKEAILWRNKIEIRPMLEIEAVNSKWKKVSLLMQNAETIRLTSPEWKPISITHMKKWDEVLAHFQEWWRHFGQNVKETISEK